MVNLGGRAGNWLAVGLFVSLAINVFAGGLLAGRYFGHHGRSFRGPAEIGGPSMPGVPGGSALQRMVANLPPEYRGAFEASLSESRREATIAGNLVREARRKLREVLIAERYDRTAVDAAFADLRTKTMEAQKVMHLAVAAAAERLPPEARRQLADAPRERPPRDRPNP